MFWHRLPDLDTCHSFCFNCDESVSTEASFLLRSIYRTLEASMTSGFCLCNTQNQSYRMEEQQESSATQLGDNLSMGIGNTCLNHTRYLYSSLVFPLVVLALYAVIGTSQMISMFLAPLV